MKHPDSIGVALHTATIALEESGSASARLDATLLLAHALHSTREVVILHPDNHMTYQAKESFGELVKRRATHEPIAYITGKKEFWGLDFSVTHDTLIPRPDSETLIEAALKRVKNRATNITILDIGTGTGCLLIALLKEMPKASGVGVDINERALRVAQENAHHHHVSERAEFLHSDWCNALNGTFDLVISNPPYIPEGDRATLMRDVVDFEPASALFAGDDGLDAYRVLAKQAPKFLKPEGILLFEVGIHQAPAVNALLQAEGMNTEKARRDLADIERCVIARKPQQV